VSGNSRLAWQGFKTMTNVPHKGRGKPTFILLGGEGLERAHQLNSFFYRLLAVILELASCCSLFPLQLF
jgi:hypothetical protein